MHRERNPVLLDDVAEAAERVRLANAEVRRAREELRQVIIVAAREQIPLAAIGRAANLSRERVRQIVGEPDDDD